MNMKVLVLSVVLVFVFSLFCLYLSPREHRKPTRMQGLMASTWLVIRRIVSFTGALCFAFFSVGLLSTTKFGEGFAFHVLGGLFFGALAMFVIFFGVFGKKSKYSLPSEDIAHHEKINKFYERE